MSGDGNGIRSGRVYLAALLSLAYLLFLHLFSGLSPSTRSEMDEAGRLMAQAIESIRQCRGERGIPIDTSADPNRTGLIGLESSPVTTSTGHLGAKRTSTNPESAALVALLLRRAGVKSGEAVAIGASSSFPAFIIATLAACRAVAAEPLLIVSLGASQWGANIPGFSWVDMEDCLREAGVLDVKPVALSLGGDEDVGRDMGPAGRESLLALLAGREIPIIEAAGLEANVAARLALYEEARGGRRMAAFVNIGGSWANMGTHADVLKLRPGLADDVPIPSPERQGVLQAMAARKIPVIHLLNVRGLAERYGLPWDPRPLPPPGRRGSSPTLWKKGAWEVVLSAGLLVLVFLIVARRTNGWLP